MEEEVRGVVADEMPRLKQDENAKLRKLADFALDREILQDVIRREI